MILKADMRMGRRSQEIYYDLKDKIETGIYVEGDKIPTETELCEIYGVARETLRRAIAKMVEENKLKVRRGDGTYVLPANVNTEDKRLLTRTISVMTPYNSEFLIELQNYILKKGFMPCLFLQSASNWDLEAEELFLNKVKADRYSGLLAYLSPAKPGNNHLVTAIQAGGTDVIYVGIDSLKEPKENYIFHDYYKAGHMAAVQLMMSGYDKFVLGTFIDAPTFALMETGFKDALIEHKRIKDFIHFDCPHNVSISPENQQYIIDFINKQEGTVGFFSVENAMAENLYNLKNHFNKSIPDEFGLISMQEKPWFTSDNYDAIEYDQMALMKMAIDTIIDSDRKTVKRKLLPEIVRKGTTK